VDSDCAAAYTLLNNDPLKWIYPRAESRFQEAMVRLRAYRARLLSGQARFSPRADNLSELLTQYISYLGTLNSDLARAPEKLRLKGAAELESERDKSPGTSFTRIDDAFYRAQGAAYVLRQMLAAIRLEFREVLEVKKAEALVEDIIQTLDQSQFEPLFVLNGDIGSITANHSLELHSILENARQKINNLIIMISQ
jgi:hypothetical protein